MEMMENKNAVLEAETGKLKKEIAALEVKMVRVSHDQKKMTSFVFNFLYGKH
jgi:hypothetical protein